MKKLFLCSSFKDVKEIFVEFNSQLTGKTVSFIAIASLVEEVNFYVEDARIVFKSLGLMIDEIEISKDSILSIKEKIVNNDFIYISGGNTFYLLQELKKYGIFEIIIEEIKKGKLYIGESAGAIITSPDIEYIKKMDDKSKAKQINEFTAMNLVDFYILPHKNSIFFKDIVNEIINEYAKKINLAPISNFDAICIFDDNIKFIYKHY